MFDDEDALFSMGSPETELLEEKRIDQEQIGKIAAAFERAGIVGGAAQTALIRTRVFRPFGSLQDLQPQDVRPILQRIEAKSASTKTISGSAWDNREGETWIDKL